MEKNRKIVKPEILGIEEWITHKDNLVPKCTHNPVKTIEGVRARE